MLCINHLSEDGRLTAYYYDHAGERTAKVTGMNQESHYDGADMTGQTSLRYTLYPSQYVTYSSGGRYTKHIYAGSQRVASVTGGELSDPSRVVPHAGTEGSLSDTIKVDFAKLYKKQTQAFDTLYPRYEVRRMANDTDGIVRQQEPQTYFYHTDHLGSTTLVTSRDGQVQQVSYMPYGEVFLEQRNKNCNTPYLFNGKEQDEESGLYYYGARYYDARKSLWLSVDPLAEIYPHITPYAYCLNNPVRNIDKKGERPSEVGGVPAREENGVWTTAQSTTYTPVVVYGQTSSTQEPDQANGCWIQGMNDSEDGVQPTAANHEAPIDPSDMNGTESWVPGLMEKLMEIFESGKTPEKEQEPVQEPTVNQPEAVEQPDTAVDTVMYIVHTPVGKAPNSTVLADHEETDTFFIMTRKDQNGRVIGSDTTKFK